MTARPAIAPRLLRQADAALYCGLSESKFLSLFDGPVIDAGGPSGGARMRRYDIRDLDAWIDRLKGAAASTGDDASGAAEWLSRLGKRNGDKAA